jgi:hypothetical protein
MDDVDALVATQPPQLIAQGSDAVRIVGEGSHTARAVHREEPERTDRNPSPRRRARELGLARAREQDAEAAAGELL